MKRLIICIIMALSVSAYAAPDTIYNQRGQAVQSEAPNFFQTMTVYSTWIDLTSNGGTLYWSLFSPAVDCKVRLTATQSKVGSTIFTIPAGTKEGYGKGYGISFVNFTGCTSGEYKAMRGDWSGQQ